MLSKSEIDTLTKRFNISDSERSFYIDENDEPNIFNFSIESIGVIKSVNILLKSLYIIRTKLMLFLNNLEKAINSSNSNVSIEKSDTVLQGFDIKIHHESHTLGNLIQSYTYYLNDPKIKYIAYYKPHPLYDYIVLRISVDDNNIQSVKSILNKSCNIIINISDNIRDQVNTEFGLQKKTITKKVSKK